MKLIDDLNSTDFELILSIAEKARKLANNRLNVATVTHYLAMVHLNGTPLKLKEMLNGNDMMHDVSGILRHTNSEGQLTDCFLPRYAQL